MPTIARKKGYRCYFYSHEPNEPPHVHVDKGGASAKVWLAPVALARSHGFKPVELSEVVDIVQPERERFMEAWYGYFGDLGR